jgi:hypothetical protein
MNRSKVVGIYLFLLGIIAALIIGCATEQPASPADPRMIGVDDIVLVTIDSLAASDAALKGKTYYITSAVKDMGDEDLQFIEFARYIENALSPKGYTRIESKENADLLVRLAFGVGAPQTTTTTYTTSMGYSYPVGEIWFTMPPKTETVQQTNFMRNLILEAYDLKDPNRKSQLWKTMVKSQGYRSDLRIVLAYMIAASADFFGTNTVKEVEIGILGHDPRVLEIWK